MAEMAKEGIREQPTEKTDLITNKQYEKILEDKVTSQFQGAMLKAKFDAKYRSFRAGKNRKLVLRETDE